MKKIILSVLLIFSVLTTGCYGSEQTTTANINENVNGRGNVSTDSPPAKSPDSDDDTDTNSTSTEKRDETIHSDSPPAQPEETPESETEPDTSVKEPQPEETPQPETPPVAPVKEPQPEEHSFFADNQTLIISAILIVLVLLTAGFLWLIYDRKKIKIRLNDLDNSPTNFPTPQVPDTDFHSYGDAIVPSTINPTPERLTLRVGNLRNKGSRQEQQDSFCLSDITDTVAVRSKGVMAVVADGMGGMEGGAQISQLVTDTFLNSYKSQISFVPSAFLYDTAESAETAVEEYIKQTGINGGSTVVAVLIKDSQMDYISVGDSHIYLLRNNRLTLINREHSFGALLKEKAARGEVDPNEPYVNPKRNALTAYIGIGNFSVADRNDQPIFLQAGDKILLCSDGVYNALGDDSLINALSGSAAVATKRLEKDILEQNIPSQDNFTAIILECVKD